MDLIPTASQLLLKSALSLEFVLAKYSAVLKEKAFMDTGIPNGNMVIPKGMKLRINVFVLVV